MSRIDFRAARIMALFAASVLAPRYLSAAELPPLEGRENLAAGRPVVFAPAPNYQLTAKGNSDATDLTDGKLTQRADRNIWFEKSSVAWSYGGRVNLAVDLGRSTHIEEIAIRLLGGSAQAGINFPGWIEALVSEDGEHYVKVGECSRWQPRDFARFGVPDDAGKSWIHCLRFTNLSVRGRWVALRMYTTGLTASDELYVFGSTDHRPATNNLAAASDFTVTHAQPYFHKPVLVLATNVAGPVPLGVVVPEAQKETHSVKMQIDLPKGVDLVAAQFAKADAGKLKSEVEPGGGKRCWLTLGAKASDKTAVRLYMQASGWKGGQAGKLTYHFASDGWESPLVEVPIQAVEVSAAPRLKRIMASLGWWSAADTAQWPGALEAWERLGFNTFPLFPGWMKAGDPTWNLVDDARRRGFFIAAVDSPFHRMVDRGKPEVFHQMADGSANTRLCPSYRGRYYREEIERFAGAMGRARPHFASVDIELWGWQGPIDSPKCSRCQEDFKASGLKSYDEWYMAKGQEMWHDLVEAARAKVKGNDGPEFEIGGYDFRPGAAYQKVWSVSRLYPAWMQSSQVSTYSCLYPYQLGLIGDEVRKDRMGLGETTYCPGSPRETPAHFPARAFSGRSWSAT